MRKPSNLARRSPLFSTLFSRKAKLWGRPQGQLHASNWHLHSGNSGYTTKTDSTKISCIRNKSNSGMFFHPNLSKYLFDWHWRLYFLSWRTLQCCIANTSLLPTTILELIPEFAIELIILIIFLTQSFLKTLHYSLQRKICRKIPSTLLPNIGPHLTVLCLKELFKMLLK